VRQRDVGGAWDRGWQRYLEKPLAVIEFDGRHHDQWAEENHRMLAAVLSNAIEDRLSGRPVTSLPIQHG
jgi:hypothetical protein